MTEGLFLYFQAVKGWIALKPKDIYLRILYSIKNTELYSVNKRNYLICVMFIN